MIAKFLRVRQEEKVSHLAVEMTAKIGTLAAGSREKNHSSL